MRDFAIYTGLRLVVLATVFGIFWVVLHNQLGIFPILMLALIVSAIASIFVLRSARDRLAGSIETRAGRIANRIEQSRRAEDDD
jgi:hypothetical protein